MATCWCRQCGSLFFRHPNHSVNPASKTSKPKSQPSDIQTGHSTLRQNTFDKFPRSDFCGLSETSALMGICPKSLILSHFITLYFSTRDINTTVSTCSVCGNISTLHIFTGLYPFSQKVSKSLARLSGLQDTYTIFSTP